MFPSGGAPANHLPHCDSVSSPPADHQHNPCHHIHTSPLCYCQTSPDWEPWTLSESGLSGFISKTWDWAQLSVGRTRTFTHPLHNSNYQFKHYWTGLGEQRTHPDRILALISAIPLVHASNLVSEGDRLLAKYLRVNLENSKMKFINNTLCRAESNHILPTVFENFS